MLDGLFADVDRYRYSLVGLSTHKQADDLPFAKAEDHGFGIAVKPYGNITKVVRPDRPT
jgi:hypothetical protein